MSVNDLAGRIEEMKAALVGMKEEKAKLEGKKESLLSQLKTDLGCSSIEEAKKKNQALEKEVNTLSEKIEKGLEELQEKYGLSA